MKKLLVLVAAVLVLSACGSTYPKDRGVCRVVVDHGMYRVHIYVYGSSSSTSEEGAQVLARACAAVREE